MSLFKRTSSFSMIEMLVVLLLSSIIVGIVYTSYLGISKYHVRLITKYSRQDALTEFYFLFKSDFNQSDQIIKGNKLRLSCIRRSAPTIVYEFLPDYIVRKHLSRSDTFTCGEQIPEFKYERKMKLDSGLIDEISFTVKDANYSPRIVLSKKYDASARIQTEKPDSIQ